VMLNKKREDLEIVPSRSDMEKRMA